MRKIFLIIICLISFLSQAQNSVKNISTADFAPDKIDTFKVFVSENNELVTHLFQDKKKLYGYLYNSELSFNDKKIYIEKFKGDLETITGHTNNESVFTLYSRDDDQWEYITLDFKNNQATINEFDFKIKSQTLLNSFTKNNVHYLVTIKKNTSVIFLYKLNPDGTHSIKEFDFSATDFSGGSRSIGNFFQLIKGSSELFETDFITSKLPLSLRSSNEKVKLYIKNSILYITSDNSRDFTYLLELDIENGNKNVKTIPKKAMAKRSSFEDSNSFIADDVLFIIKTTFEEFDFSIIDLSTLNVLQSFSVQGEEDITFKNTPINQEKGDNKDEGFTTKQFLKMVTNSKPAVSAYKQDEKWIVTLGASELTNKKAETLATVSILVSGGSLLTRQDVQSANANAIDETFLDYSRQKSTQFKLVLDSSFHKTDTKIETNVYDKIKEYCLSNELKDLSTLYKIDTIYYLNYLNTDSKQVEITEFRE